MRDVSKLRTGPWTLLTAVVQVPPEIVQALGIAGLQVVSRLGPTQCPNGGAAGSGNGRKSGPATGIGPPPVVPLEPGGPKVLWTGVVDRGSIPEPLRYSRASRKTPNGQPPSRRA